MNVYAALEHEWAGLASTRAAHARLRAWQTGEPVLAGGGNPADLVAGIVADRQWGRTDARLVALVRLAGDDLAARAVLQAILPGLKAEPLRYSRHHCRLARVSGMTV